MRGRYVVGLVLAAVLVVALACTSEQSAPVNDPDTPMASATPEYLEEDIPPCTPVEGSAADPCPRHDTGSDSTAATAPPADTDTRQYQPQDRPYFTGSIPPCTPVEGADSDPCEPLPATGSNSTAATAPPAATPRPAAHLMGFSNIGATHLVLAHHIPAGDRALRATEYRARAKLVRPA